MSDLKIPPAPKGTGPNGRRLWKSVLSAYELENHEIELLRQAVRCADLAALADKIVDDQGIIVQSASGPRANPAAVEGRLQRQLLSRLLVAIRLPTVDEDGDETGTPQRRGARGFYSGGQ